MTCGQDSKTERHFLKKKKNLPKEKKKLNTPLKKENQDTSCPDRAQLLLAAMGAAMLAAHAQPCWPFRLSRAGRSGSAVLAAKRSAVLAVQAQPCWRQKALSRAGRSGSALLAAKRSALLAAKRSATLAAEAQPCWPLRLSHAGGLRSANIAANIYRHPK